MEKAYASRVGPGTAVEEAKGGRTSCRKAAATARASIQTTHTGIRIVSYCGHPVCTRTGEVQRQQDAVGVRISV